MADVATGHREPGEPVGAGTLTTLDPAALEAAALATQPYEFVFAENAIRRDLQTTLMADAPLISSSGSIPLAQLNYGPHFQMLIDDLQSTGFRRIVERKFGLDLSGLASTISVRGRLRRSADGYTHTDLMEKVITVLLYLNPGWCESTGNFRVLRSREVDDYQLEIPAAFGNMIIFRRSDRSWHGHLPYQGPRLSLQLNWLRSLRRPRQYWRHRFNFLKRHLFA